MSEVSYELRYVQERSCEQKLASKFFSQFSQKKWFTRKFFETITCKYHKSCKNNQSKKILDFETEKAKKGPENPAKLKAQKWQGFF